MRHINVQQGTDEWLQARLGVLTASNFSKFITGGGKPSAQAEGEINKLIAERITGQRADIFTTPWMERGTELEPKARELFEFMTNHSVNQVGLILMDDYQIGCSPDGIIGSAGLEIKCPAPATHVKWLRAGTLPEEHKAQVQGSMAVTGFDTWYFMSFNELIEPLVLCIERDQSYIDKLQALLIAAEQTINEEVKKYAR
jgi:hypothetical protein